MFISLLQEGIPISPEKIKKKLNTCRQIRLNNVKIKQVSDGRYTSCISAGTALTTGSVTLYSLFH